MRTRNSSCPSDSVDAVLTGADCRIPEPRSATLRLVSLSGAGQGHREVQSRRVPLSLRNEVAELLTDIGGLPVLVRLRIRDVPAEMQSDFLSRGGDIDSLLTTTLEKIVDRIRGSSVRNDVPSKEPLATVELVSNGGSPARLPAPPTATVLCVGPLKLDLLDRSVKRGDRNIDLRPREFELLKYMMQQSDHVVARSTLFRDVWHYRFVPETNLVDVHMGRLRRKVDGADEPPLIRNIRGVGFILSATPCAPNPPSTRRKDRKKLAVADTSSRSLESAGL